MITRFAPSPTGPLHLGHAYSAMLAHDLALSAHGKFLLRIEDIDQSRSRTEWEAQIYDDLSWLGLSWETPVMRQSDRGEAYSDALDLLWDRGLLYPCSCSRRDILTAASAPQEGAPLGPDGVIYPGTCRPDPAIQMELGQTQRPQNTALRLNMGRALGRKEMSVTPNFLVESIGDVVVARRDMGTSYHLSVVVDDAAQNITHVVRGADLAEATPIHVLLQSLLGLPKPVYHHHKLIRDDQGKRLAKRDDARAISTYRSEGATPDDIRHLVGLGPAA